MFLDPIAEESYSISPETLEAASKKLVRALASVNAYRTILTRLYVLESRWREERNKTRVDLE